ncbi:MAG: hypothetical protein AAGJ83_10870, partial [Planctomycetota bacterium]
MSGKTQSDGPRSTREGGTGTIKGLLLFDFAGNGPSGTFGNSRNACTDRLVLVLDHHVASTFESHGKATKFVDSATWPILVADDKLDAGYAMVKARQC